MTKAPADAWIPETWRGADGEPLACAARIAVLNDNLREIGQMCQEAFEDAILMGADESQFRCALRALAEVPHNPFPGHSPAPRGVKTVPRTTRHE